jgi:[ribosomal protein S18]-alanine N-acetyltransferase
LPEHRRKGYGQTLKEWQIVYAREHGFKVIVTNMRRSNDPIIALNEKLGFTTREISAEYYSEPDEDAIESASSQAVIFTCDANERFWRSL